MNACGDPLGMVGIWLVPSIISNGPNECHILDPDSSIVLLDALVLLLLSSRAKVIEGKYGFVYRVTFLSRVIFNVSYKT
jgi:hypothetical protein